MRNNGTSEAPIHLGKLRAEILKNNFLSEAVSFCINLVDIQGLQIPALDSLEKIISGRF